MGQGDFDPMGRTVEKKCCSTSLLGGCFRLLSEILQLKELRCGAWGNEASEDTGTQSVSGAGECSIRWASRGPAVFPNSDGAGFRKVKTNPGEWKSTPESSI